MLTISDSHGKTFRDTVAGKNGKNLVILYIHNEDAEIKHEPPHFSLCLAKYMGLSNGDFTAEKDLSLGFMGFEPAKCNTFCDYIEKNDVVLVFSMADTAAYVEKAFEVAGKQCEAEFVELQKMFSKIVGTERASSIESLLLAIRPGFSQKFDVTKDYLAAMLLIIKEHMSDNGFSKLRKVAPADIEVNNVDSSQTVSVNKPKVESEHAAKRNDINKGNEHVDQQNRLKEVIEKMPTALDFFSFFHPQNTEEVFEFYVLALGTSGADSSSDKIIYFVSKKYTLYNSKVKPAYSLRKVCKYGELNLSDGYLSTLGIKPGRYKDASDETSLHNVIVDHFNKKKNPTPVIITYEGKKDADFLNALFNRYDAKFEPTKVFSIKDIFGDILDYTGEPRSSFDSVGDLAKKYDCDNMLSFDKIDDEVIAMTRLIPVMLRLIEKTVGEVASSIKPKGEGKKPKNK